MRGQSDVHLVVDVEPFGMVIHLFRMDRDLGHEPEGFDEILLPGEIESKVKRQRTKEGIFVEDETWEQILEWGQKFGVELE